MSKFSMQSCLVIDGEHALFVTDEDVKEFNNAASCVDKELDKQQILDFLSVNTHIYYRGKMWGFNDTEVREALCEILEDTKEPVSFCRCDETVGDNPACTRHE